MARDDVTAGLIDLIGRIGDLEVHDPAAFDQALGMLAELENLAVVGPLALEHGAGVMQGVGQDVDLGFAPGHELAVEPDEAVAVVIGDDVSHARVIPGGDCGPERRMRGTQAAPRGREVAKRLTANARRRARAMSRARSLQVIAQQIDLKRETIKANKST